MIARLIALLRQQPDPVVDMADLIIAKRSAESRRNDAVAASYRTVHADIKHKLGRPYLPPPDRRERTT